MRKLMVFFSMVLIAAAITVNFTSCTDDPPPVPTIKILADVNPDGDGYEVIITVESANVETFEWNYGDGNTSATAGSHMYTYQESGDYTISVKAIGPGGEVTASDDVSIAASLTEIIAGATDEGKTWILTSADGAGKMGVGDFDNSLALKLDVIPANILTAFGLGDEYGDEFTFFKDGKFTVDNKNGKALASALYGGVLTQMGIEGITSSTSINDLPLSSVPMANIDNGTWAISYDEFTMMAQNEIGIAEADQKIEQKAFTFEEGSTRFNLKLSTNAYIGFFDLTYPAIPGMLDNPVDNSIYIVKEVNTESMSIAIASCGLSELLIYPTYMLHLTLVPKQ